jgi:hypothetical protein
MREFTVHNDDFTASSQLKFGVRVIDARGHFSADCPPSASFCELGPGESMTIAVAFESDEAGHEDTQIVLLATARNAAEVRLVAHAFGGEGFVPWGTPDTGFYYSARQVWAVTPAGSVMHVDTGTGLCLGGSLDGSPCVTDQDCSDDAPCGDRLCFGSDNAFAACGGPEDCPGGTCGEVLEPIDLCADGTGSVYIMNDEARFDINDDHDPPESGMILRAGLDGSRSTVTTKVTEESPVIGCQPGPGGRIFWANYELVLPAEDEKEALRSVPKTGGTIKKEINNINARMGDADPLNYIDPTDGFVYYEPSTALRVASNGALYMANFYGLYRLAPTPALLVTRDVSEKFDLFPDGSLLMADVLEDDAEATMRLYKVDPSLAVTGAVTLRNLRPWAVARIPNNRGACGNPCRTTTFITSMAVDSGGSAFVSVYTTGGVGTIPHLLRPHGTLRFEAEADGTTGRSTGFVILEIQPGLDF